MSFPIRMFAGILACICAHIAGNEGNGHAAAWFGFLAGIALLVSLMGFPLREIPGSADRS